MGNTSEEMELAVPSLSPGCRRKFDEYAEDEEEQVVREHRPLQQQLPNAPFVRDHGIEQGRTTWTGLVCNTLNKGIRVVVVLSSACRRTLRRLPRVEEWRIRQTADVVVEGYIAAKRRLVRLQTTVPVPPNLRRQSPPRQRINGRLSYQARVRQAEEERDAALGIRRAEPRPPLWEPVVIPARWDPARRALAVENVEAVGPAEEMDDVEAPRLEPGPEEEDKRAKDAAAKDAAEDPELMVVDELPSTPVMPGSFPVDVAPSPPVVPYPPASPSPAPRPATPVASVPDATASPIASPASFTEAPTANTQDSGEPGMSIKATQSHYKSIADDMDIAPVDASDEGDSMGPDSSSLDDLLDESVVESKKPQFLDVAASLETCGQLTVVQDVVDEGVAVASPDSAQEVVELLSHFPAIVAEIDAQQESFTTEAVPEPSTPSESFTTEVLPEPSTPTESPRRSVAFFASPKTGRPITKTKKFIKGEAMNYPVSSSPVSEELSTLTSISDSELSAISPTNLARSGLQDTYAENDLTESEITHSSVLDITSNSPEPAGRSQDTSSQSETPETAGSVAMEADQEDSTAMEDLDSASNEQVFLPRAGTADGAGVAAEEEASSAEVEALEEEAGSAEIDALKEESIAVEDIDSTSDEQVSSPNASDSESKHVNQTVSKPPRRKEPRIATRKSARLSIKAGTESQNLDIPFSKLGVSSISKRRGSSRGMTRSQKDEARRQKLAAHEAAVRARVAHEKAEKKAGELAEVEEKARKEAEAEEERRKNAVRRVPREKIIQPLDAAWERKVQEALDAPNMRQVLVDSPSGANLTRKDLGTLKVVRGRDPAHGWLNDEIIAACLQQVVDYGLRISNHKAGETPKYHAFNTFFYKNLRDKGVQSVKRWAGKAKIGAKELLKAERVFIPVHQGAHWTLLVISPLARTIEYFDSLGGHAAPYIQNAKQWLAEELTTSWNEEEWTVPTGAYGAGPRQFNGSDCGVFTCTTARMVVLGVDPMAYGGDDMEMQRSRMVAELLNGGLVGDFEPRVVF